MDSLYDHIGNTDIYLIDQIMKGRYNQGERIFDAGCREGRNLHWFFQNHFDIYGVDTDDEALKLARETYSASTKNFSAQNLEKLDFKSNYFDHTICAAVLHFAHSTEHFKQLFAELIRVTKKGGSLFIRMASTIGNPGYFKALENGRYLLADETERFLLTPKLISELQETYTFKFLELVKTTNVQNLRYMTTLVIEK